jgi:nucleoside-diphosphate-sugar epimerase
LPPPFPRNRAELRSASYRRFFAEEDDTQRELSGPNLKANEFLNWRLTVEDAADAHVVALDRAPALGFETFVLSAPTPFLRSEAEALKRAAVDAIERHFPDAPALYERHGWRLPTSIGRVYDASRIERVLGFRCATDFGRVLNALRTNGRLPFAHKPAYRSPSQSHAVS